jgi:hypothetical protein
MWATVDEGKCKCVTVVDDGKGSCKSERDSRAREAKTAVEGRGPREVRKRGAKILSRSNNN